MPKLVVLNRTLTAMAHELGEKWVTIGRHDGNVFQIGDASVSGRHCEVRLRGDELIVRDLQSTNGTFVDGKKVSEGVVKPGQTLRVGEVELRLEASAPAETSGGSFTSKLLAAKTAPGATKPAEPGRPAPGAETKPAAPAESAGGPVKKYQVLFVDDSLAFLESFTELCLALSNQVWEIHTAPSADRALAILQQHTIDLVVLDIVMPMVDGLQLLGVIGRRYPGLKIVVMTGKANDAHRAACLAGGAELFIEKPVSPEAIKMVFNMLNDLVSWTHREGFSGTLRQVNLQEVIQMECIARHSSILEIRNQQMLGQIFIEAGVVTHAAVGMLTGEKAFNRLLSLAGGEFELKPFKAPPQRTVQSGWEMLLMEAARHSDEETVVTPKTPANVPPPPAPPAPTPAEHAVLGDDIVVVATYDPNDGQWNPADEPKTNPPN
ncbi:MAG TPA: response regulator [Verrucomicrobiae bacterium]|nr:response regulator [Verrucomicrobiae bacterium]